MDRLTRHLAIALSVSVALNLFLLGFGLSRVLGHRDRTGRPPTMEPALQQAWAPHKDRLRPLRQQVRAARRQVRTALLTEPFERAELESALSNLRATTDAGQQAFHAALVDIAAQTDRDGRRAMADNRRLWRDVGQRSGPAPRRHPHPPGAPAPGPPPAPRPDADGW